MSRGLLVYIPDYTLRHQYIFDLIFNNIYHIEYKITDQKEEYLHSESYKINYSKNKLDQEEIFVKPIGLLDKKGVSEIEVEINEEASIPTFFNSDDPESYSFDLFSAAFLHSV